MNTSMKYTLAVPATNATIGALFSKIIDDVAEHKWTKLDRVELCFGTCRLLCQDERERVEQRTSVTLNEVLIVLLSSMSG